MSSQSFRRASFAIRAARRSSRVGTPFENPSDVSLPTMAGVSVLFSGVLGGDVIWSDPSLVLSCLFSNPSLFGCGDGLPLLNSSGFFCLFFP